MQPSTPPSSPVALRRALPALLVLCLGLAALPAAAWEVNTGAPEAALEDFHRHFSLGIYPTPRHSAAPLGWVGFDIYADVSALPDLTEQGRVGEAVSGDLPGDLLAVGRVGVRKGLPGKIDLGLSYGQVLDADFELVSGEVQWAILEGGVVSPALGLRLTGTRSVDDGVYDLEQYGLEVQVSKGFTLLTVYGGAGLVRSESTFDRGLDTLSIDSTDEIYYAGVILNLLIPKISVEVAQGEELQGAVRIAFGL